HRALAQLGSHGGEPEAAVADHHRGDAVPPRQRQVRIPEELRVVVRVEVDEPRGDDRAARIEDPARTGGAEPADRRNPTAADADVGAIALRARAVDDDPVPDHDVEHGVLRHPAATARRRSKCGITSRPKRRSESSTSAWRVRPVWTRKSIMSTPCASYHSIMSMQRRGPPTTTERRSMSSPR